MTVIGKIILTTYNMNPDMRHPAGAADVSSQKFAFLKRKEAFNQSVFVKMF
jgi:hypothetical protein